MVLIILSVSQAKAFRSDPSTNPTTNRKITVDGRVYKELEKACDIALTPVRTVKFVKEQPKPKPVEVEKPKTIKQKREEFRANPRINPETGRAIQLGGPTYRALTEQYGITPEWPEDDLTQAQCDLTAARDEVKLRKLNLINVTAVQMKIRDDIARTCGREFRSLKDIEAFTLHSLIHPKFVNKYHNEPSTTDDRIGDIKYEFMEIMYNQITLTEVYRDFDALRKVMMAIPIQADNYEKI